MIADVEQKQGLVADKSGRRGNSCMQRKSSKLVPGALEAGRRIQEHSSELTLEKCRQQRWVRRAFERECEIIGEALSRLEKLDPGVAGQIPEPRPAVDFRNRIIHDYDELDDEIVGNTIRRDVPSLTARPSALLNLPEEGTK